MGMYQRNMNYPDNIWSSTDEDSDQEILFENDLLLMKKMQMEADNLERLGGDPNTKENNSCYDWKSEGMQIACGHCQHKVTTEVTTNYGNLAHKLALVLFFLTCGVGVFLPYCCFSSLRYVTHRCPLCSAIFNAQAPENFNRCTHKIASVTVAFVAFMMAALILFVVFVYLPEGRAPLDQLDGSVLEGSSQ